jgi:hypothetical protein
MEGKEERTYEEWDEKLKNEGRNEEKQKKGTK